MPFFKPPTNALAPYQLELLASVFRTTWSEILPRGRRLPQTEEQRLQSEISSRLCSLAAKGLIDPLMLQALTVATVRVHPHKTRRRTVGRHLR
jgi:hypothetical protein